jgi:hypothetical protein
MNCAEGTKEWIIYDAKQGTFLKFSNEEFKTFINGRPEFSPIKWKDVEILNTNTAKMVWIDGIINAEDFK